MAINKAIPLEAAPRTEFGKGAARRARRDGLIPVVIYSKSIDEPLHVTVDRLDFTAIIRNHGVNAVVDVDIEGEKQLAIVKHLDQNVLTFNIDHVDLLAISRGEKIEVEVPVVHTGEPAPGAMVIQDADVLAVEAPVLSIPEEFEIDIEGLEIGTQITAADVKLEEGITLVSDPETLIINIVEPEEEELPEPEGEEGEGDAEGESVEATEEGPTNDSE
ncbi:50S ribosomal protein L25/general stress protein Ctc [Corynebacterium sp. CCM 8835]|uniref:Large ribosomal subunit protein bL25 n=1 Tax=Corynebacterium antarcticum TaxID=2800405 RepID=A0A9Q4GL42_9CORY|nr:50S ribosomal protein L25/general stress protein Ctc [Corynebacterium antarcticum]MCK7642845.1 50S ribosomal protein L25/general stress protein Ctc [Corynebacterium antarcticum]MCK7661348.1 50S ribosomal protein L25/general stress protein Ctc [Corynebacterium antarcticum]MCL0246084.1 50S ribosomal protein L25/general stress protein Ctc [Corynebacterium antarcticum]MCX7492333.1 50S ribosomal protein L25/general stress protein Ctc [Corynebacterium antarcticum]MCX7538552.1 50S ribosomal protei